jgi:hypothetical protein
MIAMAQTEYNSIANESLEELRQETPQTKIKLKKKTIQTK